MTELFDSLEIKAAYMLELTPGEKGFIQVIKDKGYKLRCEGQGHVNSAVYQPAIDRTLKIARDYCKERKQHPRLIRAFAFEKLDNSLEVTVHLID